MTPGLPTALGIAIDPDEDKFVSMLFTLNWRYHFCR